MLDEVSFLVMKLGENNQQYDGLAMLRMRVKKKKKLILLFE
jgi:hypothetical protein